MEKSACEQLRSGCCGRRPPARPLSTLWRAQPGRGRSAGWKCFDVLSEYNAKGHSLQKQNLCISKGVESNAARLLDHLRPGVFQPLFGDQGSRHGMRIVARPDAEVNLLDQCPCENCLVLYSTVMLHLIMFSTSWL